VSTPVFRRVMAAECLLCGIPHNRHSWVTHLTEDGVDRRFIQEAVGHRCDTSTAIYTHVSGDFMNTALRKALEPALGQPG
jgi:integrase/recombinase XerC